MARNYQRERKYDAQPHVKQKRSNRTSARNKLIRKGVVRVGDGKDVHHVGGNALNKKSKLKVVPASKNRSFARTKTGRKVNPRA